MATVRACALSLSVLLALVALCLTASAAEQRQQQPTNRYISYAGVPRARGGNGAGTPRGNGHSVLSRCKTCHGQPPAKAAAETAAAAAESKGTDIGHAAVTMTGAKTAAATITGAKKAAATITGAKKAAAAMTGAKTADAGSEGGYITPAAL